MADEHAREQTPVWRKSNSADLCDHGGEGGVCGGSIARGSGAAACALLVIVFEIGEVNVDMPIEE